jgi:hypothetical protein
MGPRGRRKYLFFFCLLKIHQVAKGCYSWLSLLIYREEDVLVLITDDMVVREKQACSLSQRRGSTSSSAFKAGFKLFELGKHSTRFLCCICLREIIENR